jgi:insertion element IS1 protein InsB
VAETAVRSHIDLHILCSGSRVRCGAPGVKENFSFFTILCLRRTGRSDLSACSRYTTYRECAIFYTDQYAAYTGVIPAAQHKAINKRARKTNHIERFNNTLRQRISRLVRSTLAFSKKVENHIGAIQYFICHYNLTRAALLV